MPETLVLVRAGVGKITATKERWGSTWALIEPVDAPNSIRLEKWVLLQDARRIVIEKAA